MMSSRILVYKEVSPARNSMGRCLAGPVAIIDGSDFATVMLEAGRYFLTLQRFQDNAWRYVIGKWRVGK